MNASTDPAPAATEGGGTIHVGPAGWSYPDWEGRVYPPRTGDRLVYLARHFTAVEINSSFYRIPEARTTAGWAARVAEFPHFRFTVKLWRGFTHQRGTASAADTEAFSAALAPLNDAGRLGALLVQFPWSFRFDEKSRKTVQKLIRPFERFSPVVEVRHGSWGSPEAERFLAELGAGFCCIDQPAVGDSLGILEAVTGEVGYVRFHGRNARDWFRDGAGRDARYDYLYDEKELDPWCRRIRRIASRAGRTFVVTNNHFQGQAVVNALEILSRLTARKVAVPDPLPAFYPRLEAIRAYTPGSQPRLF